MADQFVRKSNENSRVAPTGDDIEPAGESRADVEMRNEKDEEPWKQKFPESE